MAGVLQRPHDNYQDTLLNSYSTVLNKMLTGDIWPLGAAVSPTAETAFCSTESGARLQHARDFGRFSAAIQGRSLQRCLWRKMIRVSFSVMRSRSVMCPNSAVA